MRFTGALVFALFFCSISAIAQPDVREILAKVSTLYTKATQYELVAESRSMKPGSAENNGHALFAFRAPNRYHMEGVPGGDADTREAGTVTIIDDGSVIWFYMPKVNQYSSIPVSALNDAAAGDLADLKPERQDDSAMGRYRHADRSEESHYLRDESVDYAGTKVDCYVLSVSQEGIAHTWWIDKKNYRILRDDDAEASVVFTHIGLGEPVPDDLFRFVPPPGSKETSLQQ